MRDTPRNKSTVRKTLQAHWQKKPEFSDLDRNSHNPYGIACNSRHLQEISDELYLLKGFLIRVLDIQIVYLRYMFTIRH